MSSEDNNVATPSQEYMRQATYWALPRTLMGGTRAMRAASTNYLPMETAESTEAYKARLLRTTLFNAFRKTVSDMTGKVFRKEIQIGKDVPPELSELYENVDNAGRHLNVFGRDVFFDAMQVGVNFIFVEMPPALATGTSRDGTVTLADEATLRPYLCLVTAENLIGWKTQIIDGTPTLMQARIRECVTEDDGRFGTKDVVQIRVLTPGAWETWRQSTDPKEKNNWVRHEVGMTSLDYIPLYPVYLNRTGFFTAEPPLEDLADLNLAHWQSQSDQKTILHVARVPILFLKGFKDDDRIEIGSSRAIRSSNENADIKYVEHTGAAIDAGDKDLQNLEAQMQTQGLQLLTPQPGGKTATGEVHDSDKENSQLAMMARSLEDALEAASGAMLEYMGKGDVESAGSLTVNKDFGITATAGLDIPNIINATSAGIFDKSTALREFQRREFLAPSEDVEKIATAAKSESEALGANIPPGGGMNLNG